MFGKFCLNRHAFGHTIAAGLIFGPFAAYLSMAQQILQIQYELGEDFPLVFRLAGTFDWSRVLC